MRREEGKVEMWMNEGRSGMWWPKLWEHLKRNDMVIILEDTSSQLFHLQTQCCLSLSLK